MCSLFSKGIISWVCMVIGYLQNKMLIAIKAFLMSHNLMLVASTYFLLESEDER